jgi:hypothetical protein
MSLLISEPPRCARPVSGSRVAVTTRMVDTATRLHAWSIPLPCCVHGMPFEQHCEQCNAVAPLDTVGPASS